MCHHNSRRNVAPVIFSAPAANNNLIGYQCTCGRRRCRCGPSGMRVMDPNMMTTMTGHNQMHMGLGMMSINDGYGREYGYGRRGRRRRQGPITALVGGLINLAVDKHSEKKAVRSATNQGDQYHDSSDSSDSEDSYEMQTRDVVRTEKDEKKSLQARSGHPEQQQNGQALTSTSRARLQRPSHINTNTNIADDTKRDGSHWESGPPPYRP